MATLDEASKCPRCELTGEAGTPKASAKPGVSVITYTCKNTRCVWYDTGWIVQVNPDGSIPDPQQGPKQFARPDDLLVAQTIDQVDNFAAMLQRRSTGGR